MNHIFPLQHFAKNSLQHASWLPHYCQSHNHYFIFWTEKYWSMALKQAEKDSPLKSHWKKDHQFLFPLWGPNEQWTGPSNPNQKIHRWPGLRRKRRSTYRLRHGVLWGITRRWQQGAPTANFEHSRLAERTNFFNSDFVKAPSAWRALLHRKNVVKIWLPKAQPTKRHFRQSLPSTAGYPSCTWFSVSRRRWQGAMFISRWSWASV